MNKELLDKLSDIIARLQHLLDYNIPETRRHRVRDAICYFYGVFSAFNKLSDDILKEIEEAESLVSPEYYINIPPFKRLDEIQKER